MALAEQAADRFAAFDGFVDRRPDRDSGPATPLTTPSVTWSTPVSPSVAAGDAWSTPMTVSLTVSVDLRRRERRRRLASAAASVAAGAVPPLLPPLEPLRPRRSEPSLGRRRRADPLPGAPAW